MTQFTPNYKQKKPLKSLFGFLTFFFPICMALHFIYSHGHNLAFRNPGYLEAHDSRAEPFNSLVIPLNAFVVFGLLCLITAYLLHIKHNQNLSSGRQWIYQFGIAVFPILIMPLYFLRHIWPEHPTSEADKLRIPPQRWQWVKSQGYKPLWQLNWVWALCLIIIGLLLFHQTVASVADTYRQPQGDLVADIKLVDLAKQAQVAYGAVDSIYEVAVSPNGDLIVLGTSDGNLYFLDIQGKLLHHIYAHNEGVLALAFTADGQHLISGGRSTREVLSVWDVTDYSQTFTTYLDGFRVDHITHSSVSSLIATQLYELGESTGRVMFWQFSEGELALVDTLPFPDRIENIAFSPNDDLLAIEFRKNDISFRDP
ncbi:MAG: WD40 repeat domain-containing protein, partial [Chloroflexota bacterium]